MATNMSPNLPEKVELNTNLVNGKFLECNNRMQEINNAQKDAEDKVLADEKDRARVEREAIENKRAQELNEELLVAKQASNEIEIRCSQLVNKFKT